MDQVGNNKLRAVDADKRTFIGESFHVLQLSVDRNNHVAATALNKFCDVGCEKSVDGRDLGGSS